MGILVVILNYRTADLTIDCLRSLMPEIASVEGVRVLVVDNASGDGSAESIAQAIADNDWGEWASVLNAGRNGGFAAGNNRGVEATRHGKYILLLNSDTVVHPGALAHCVRIMEADPGIGAMSCLVLNRDGTVQNVSRRLPTPPRMWACALGLPWKFPRLFEWADQDDLHWDRLRMARDVGWLGGAFLFTRRDLIDRIGGLDEDFFFYGEDVEFSYRVWEAGYRCWYDPTGGKITHFGGSSSDPTRVPSRQRRVMMWQARYLVQAKCYGRWAARTLCMLDRLAFRLRATKLAVLGRRRTPEYDLATEMLSVLDEAIPPALRPPARSLVPGGAT